MIVDVFRTFRWFQRSAFQSLQKMPKHGDFTGEMMRHIDRPWHSEHPIFYYIWELNPDHVLSCFIMFYHVLSHYKLLYIMLIFHYLPRCFWSKHQTLPGRKLSDPAICLIYGTSSFDGTVRRLRVVEWDLQMEKRMSHVLKPMVVGTSILGNHHLGLGQKYQPAKILVDPSTFHCIRTNPTRFRSHILEVLCFILYAGMVCSLGL